MKSPISIGDIHCILVGLQTKEMLERDFSRSLRELEKLVDTLGYQIETTVTQKRPRPQVATIVSSGKIAEIQQIIQIEERVNALVFDFEISPTQQRNLEDIFQIAIMDRTSIILEIFYRRARTREAKLQCELARLRYLSPRLRMSHQLDRQAGGIGAKGVGETQHELDKRRIRDRIAELNQLLRKVRKTQALQRSKRMQEMRLVLFGYTNAGKSSLMRALTKQDIYVEDKLFATLDTKVRALKTSPKILVTDTVGIINNIPHHLIASFHSTMDEAKSASLLLHVVDVSDEDWRKQLESGVKILDEIEAKEAYYQLVLNKVDLLTKAELNRYRMLMPNAIFVSVNESQKMDQLVNLIKFYFEQDMKKQKLTISYEDQESFQLIYCHCKLLRQNYHEKGVDIEFLALPGVLAELKKVNNSEFNGL